MKNQQEGPETCSDMGKGEHQAHGLTHILAALGSLVDQELATSRYEL